MVAITTIDNKYDPLRDFDSWFAFDMGLDPESTTCYNTCGLLARVAKVSSKFTDEENQAAVEEAINTIINLDPTGMYKKVTM